MDCHVARMGSGSQGVAKSALYRALPMAVGVCALLVAAVSAGGSAPAARAQTAESVDQGLHPKLAPLAPYLGKTFRGEFVGSTPQKPVYDVSHWEPMLGGKAVRCVHSVNDGEYGGESIILWDAAQESLVFFYVTTAGFYTQGTMTIEGDTLTSHEAVKANQGGITEVRAVSRLLSDGGIETKAEFLKDGEWVPGHEIHYQESPDSVVRFR